MRLVLGKGITQKEEAKNAPTGKKCNHRGWGHGSAGKCLPFRQEDLNLIPRYHPPPNKKKLCGTVCTCHPSAREAETVGSLGLTGQPILPT